MIRHKCPSMIMTVRWIIYFGTAGAQHSNGRKFEYQIPQGYHVPHCVGNPHWRIPNSSVRTNSSETRRTSSLSLKNMTELYEISNGFTRRDWQVQDFELSITWKFFLSISSTPFNSTVFPMTQERENETIKTTVFTLHVPRMNAKSSRSHQFLHFQSLQEVFRNTKVFSRRTSFLGVDFLCKYQTPHRLIDLCTLTNALVP